MEGGKRRATVNDLSSLTAAAHMSDPRLITITDQIPKDPRLPVEFRHADRMYRIHPDNMERPIAVLWKAEMVAELIDEALLSALGFSLSDYLDLSLVYMDAAVRKLHTSWTQDPPTDTQDSGRVTEEEVNAYQAIPDPGTLVALCPHPDAAALALDWATFDAAAVASLRDSPLNRFRWAMAIRSKGGSIVREPPSETCAAINLACLNLATEAVRHRRDLEDAFFRMACEQVARRLRRLHFTFVPELTGPGRASATMFVQVAEKTFIAINVVSSLDGSQVDLTQAAEHLAALKPGQEVRSGHFRRTIPLDARIARLMVGVTPTHSVVRSGRGIAGMSLEDLDWITAELSETPDDFWWFVQDLGDPPGIGTLMNWESIDAFEHWRVNRSFLVSGVQLDLVVITPHRSDAEYLQALERGPIETALMSCGEPPIRTFGHFSQDDNGDAFLYDDSRSCGVRVLSQEFPVCLELSMSEYPADGALFAENVSGGIAWKLEHMPPLSWLHTRFGVTGLVISVEWDDGSQVAGRLVDHQHIAVIISPEAVLLCEVDSSEFEAQVAGAIASGLAQLCRTDGADPDIAAFTAAWHEASSGIRMDSYEIRQVEVVPPRPEEISLPARKRHEHAINRYLLERGVKPGCFSDETARDFESKIVAPMLLGMLHEHLAKFDAHELLGRALRQYDLANAKRLGEERKISFAQRFDEFTLDPAAASKELIEDSMRLTRAQAVVIEEALVRRPNGVEIPDRVQWTEILALADILFDAQMHSEAIHVGLTRDEIIVTDSFDVEFRSLGPGRCDLAAFTAAYVDGTKIGPRLPLQTRPAASQEGPDSGAEEPGQPILDLAVDEALMASLGFRARTLLQVLLTLTSWPERPNQHPCLATVDQLNDFCNEGIDAALENETRAAIEWLILTHEILGDDPLEHWEQDRRDARVLIRPLVQLPGGLIAVMPWAIESTLRVFIRHLSDGRLPWPRRIVPAAVQRAIDAYRQRRNEDLEDEVYEGVSALGYACRKRVKKAAVLGLKNLSGEIDVVVANEATGTLWVLEVKDPHETFSHRQIGNAIDDFVGTSSRRGYLAKLEDKVADISVDPSSVATALQANEPRTSWAVKGAIVTRRPVPAAFAGTGVPFVVPESLPALLAT